MKKIALPVILLFSQLNTLYAQQAGSVLQIMQRVAGWQLLSWERDSMRAPAWDWTNGACYAGFMALNKVANDTAYSHAMFATGKALEWNTGPHRTLADDYCVAQMFAQMYMLYKQPVMIEHFKQLADSIIAMPHIGPLAMTDDIVMTEWAWSDALFMGPPALAYLSTATGERKYLDTACKLWWKTTDYLFDKNESLYYRDSKFFNQHEANGKKVFWSRGNGWVMGGLVRVLENMPGGYPERLRFVELYKKMAAKIAALQQADGTWHASLLNPSGYPAKETSGTGFYCYALTWGINNGLLDYNRYYPVVTKAWAALAASVHSDGKLGYVQQIGEKPEAVGYDDTEVYGVGAFLLAGSQMVELLLHHSHITPVVTLYNPTGLNRKEEVITMPYQRFIKAMAIGGKNFKITNALTGEEIAYQPEYKGTGKPVNILLQVSLGPGAEIFINTINQPPASPISKTYARYVPERLDDFAWENDRIAFRVYGKALETTNENGYGLDVWAKKTNKLIIDKWYKIDDYHVDHGEGMDFYNVGNSLGAGNIAPYINGSIVYSSNYRQWKILDNGPLRSSFQLTYQQKKVNEIIYTETKTITLDAGSQLNKIEVTYSSKTTGGLPVATGIVKRAGDGNVLMDRQTGVMGYWQPQHGNDGTIGIGCVSIGAFTEMKETGGHYLMVSQLQLQKPFVYYAGAAWDKAGIITNAGDWFNYLEDFKARLQRPVIVKW